VSVCSSVCGWIVATVSALVLAGCGGTGGDAHNGASTTAERQAAPPSLVEKCTERFLRRVPEAEREDARRYVEVTYCSRFAGRGWVYDDGALSIEAHKWLEEGGEEECAKAAPESEPAKPARTVPCEELNRGGPKLIGDCNLLHYVRRSEVRDYVEKLRHRHGDVDCEDGTPLDELGTP
jgi:hypothetical protein